MKHKNGFEKILLLLCFKSCYDPNYMFFKGRYVRHSSNCNLSNCELIQIKKIRDFNEILTHGPCVSAAAAPNVLVFLAQWIEHCSADAESVEVPNFFFRVNLQLLKLFVHEILKEKSIISIFSD